MILNALTKEGDKNAKLGALRYRMYLALMTSVNIDNFPKAINATISSNVLLPGEVFKHFDAMVNTIKPNVQPGQIPTNGKITLTPFIDGLSKQTLQWAYDNAGQDFLVVWERCSDNQRFIAGDPCSGGLKLTYTAIGELEGGTTGIATAFTGGECPEPFWFYDGPIPLNPPVYVPADATTFALTDSSQYQLTDNTSPKVLSDITGVTDSHVGRVFEIIGAGSTNATKISPNTKFMLNKGLDFVASAGSRISFYVMKTGTSSYVFVEVNRG